ncbi:hypothetical protein PSACC_02700, partial [Paramicrosporidium saccamoebae]
ASPAATKEQATRTINDDVRLDASITKSTYLGQRRQHSGNSNRDTTDKDVVVTETVARVEQLQIETRLPEQKPVEPVTQATQCVESSAATISSTDLEAPTSEIKMNGSDSQLDKLRQSTSHPAPVLATKSSHKNLTAQAPTALRCELQGQIQKVIVTSGIDGKLSLLNDLAKRWGARAIIHTGNFGFYDANNLRFVASREIGQEKANSLSDEEVKSLVTTQGLLSEFPDFVSGVKRLDVPVYVVWGQYEDFAVIEKLKRGVYHVPNLYILDHRNSFAISSGSTTLRLFGLGGSFSYPKLFDVGLGNDSVSGGDGKMWATLVQLGELLDLAEKYEDLNEVRVFISQVNPSKEPLAHFVATAIRAEYSVSTGDTTICSIFNDRAIHTVQTLNAFMKPTKEDIKSMWDQIYFACNEKFTNVQRKSCQKFISCIEKSYITEEILHRCTHINMCSIQYGEAKLCLSKEKISIESGHVRDTLNVFAGGSLKLASNTLAGSSSKLASDAPFSNTCKSTSDIFVGGSSKSVSDALASDSSKSTSDVLVNNSPKSMSDVPAGDSSKLAPDLPVNGSSSPASSTNPSGENLTSSVDPLFSALPSATSRPEESSSFYMDRRGSSNPDLSCILKNLPRDISGAELDEECLSKYDIESINFRSPRNEVALVTFKSVEERNRAMSELTDTMVRGRTIFVAIPHAR